MDDQFSVLLGLDPKTVRSVPNKGEKVPARITKVTDGDTIQVIFLHGNKVPMKLSLRVDGIDSPELNNWKQKDLELRQLEKQAASLVTDYVKHILFKDNPDGLVHIYIKKNDKYGGRVVADLFFGENYSSNLSTCLLNEGYANPYNGRTKKTAYTRADLEAIQDNLCTFFAS